MVDKTLDLLPSDHVPRKQNFWFPVFGGGNIFNDDAPATSAVYTEYSFWCMLDHHRNVLDIALAAKKHQIAGLYIIQGNFHTLCRLCACTGGYFYLELI